MERVTRLFTFGYGHLFKNHFVKITASSHEECREVMFHTFHDKWSMDYSAKDEEKLIASDMKPLMEINATEGNATTKLVEKGEVKGEYPFTDYQP